MEDLIVVTMTKVMKLDVHADHLKTNANPYVMNKTSVNALLFTAPLLTNHVTVSPKVMP